MRDYECEARVNNAGKLQEPCGQYVGSHELAQLVQESSQCYRTQLEAARQRESRLEAQVSDALRYFPAIIKGCIDMSDLLRLLSRLQLCMSKPITNHITKHTS